MKNKAFVLGLLLLTIVFLNPVYADDEERKVPSFSEIALAIPATLYLEQGDKQSVEIVAKPSTLEEIKTEVKGRKLNIRFPNKNYIWKKFNPGKIEIFITVPDLNALSISGSGKIIADDKIEARILDITGSGSGDLVLDELVTERLKVSMSGSGSITVSNKNVAEDLSVSMSGSGSFKGIDFEVQDAIVRISGSGNCSFTSNGSIKARIAGSGNVRYKGNPSIDSSVAGSGKVRKM